MNNVSGYFKKPTQFLLSAVQPRQYPNVVFPEVAFIGRSNVGKSSLINEKKKSVKKRFLKTNLKKVAQVAHLAHIELSV